MLRQTLQKILRCWLGESNTSEDWIEGERKLWMFAPIVLFLTTTLILVIILNVQRRVNSLPKMLFQTAYCTFFLLHVEVAF